MELTKGTVFPFCIMDISFCLLTIWKSKSLWTSRDVSHLLLFSCRINSEPFLPLESITSEVQIENVCLEALDLQFAQGTRRMTHLETISASWIICDSWAGVAATVSLAIAQGGPVTLTYGLIAMFILGGACVLTLAELASVYPTAGGQYHWVSILAPKRTNRALVCLLSA